ncbi:MAG: YkgJ family cysteine cluster protein [Chloroflexales bacterium]|nr:YkgJ family cysteine cluster protein [Chloroflexales bacterium]
MSEAVGACRACEGRCCTAYTVPLTGDDVWRIVQGQRLAPIAFVQRDPESTPTTTGFLLRPGGATYGIALRHQPGRRNEWPCIFLMHLRDGVQRCGIYAHRPLACQTYPMRLQPTGVAPRDDMLCPPGSWAGIAQHPGAWHERLLQQDRQWQRYAVVVQAWNTAVRRCPPSGGFVLDQYLAYLVAAYDTLNPPDDQPADPAHDSLDALAEAWCRSR